MGNICRRRAIQLDENEGWILVPGAQEAANNHANAQPNINVQPNIIFQNIVRSRVQGSLARFRKTVKLAIKLLFIRRHWAAIGRYLETPASRLYPARRNVLSVLWSSWRQQYVLRFSHVFGHLKRERGVLRYR